MTTQTEQQYQAQLLRERQEEQRANTETQNTDETETKKSSQTRKAKTQTPSQNRFPISPIEVGLWLFPGITIDMFEFFGQAVAAIPVVGLPLAGASSVVGAVMSGIMFLLVGLWLIMKKVTPLGPVGLRVFLVLGGTAFGNAVINWLPAWSGFFLWLFFMAHKQAMLPSEKNK